MSARSKITLYENSDHIVVQSSDRPHLQLQIDRRTFALTEQQAASPPLSATATAEYDRLAGSIQLLSGHYLVLVKQSRALERPIFGRSSDQLHVRQCVEFELKPVLADQQLQTLQSALHQSDEKRYLELLIDELLHKDPRSFYYSADSSRYDLSRTLQSQMGDDAVQDGDVSGVWSCVDEQFVWNLHLAKAFLHAGVGRWITPIIRGCKLSPL